MLGTKWILAHVILWERYSYYTHFTDGETEAQKVPYLKAHGL